MSSPPAEYDRRYLGGILLFNDRDFFEAHEVWEDLWADCGGAERRFVQGLIQAAVGLCHFTNGNTRGAYKLYHSARNYMQSYPSPYLGLHHAAFWRQMERCFAEVLAAPEPERQARLDPDLIPVLALDPPPEAWPDLAEFEHPDD